MKQSLEQQAEPPAGEKSGAAPETEPEPGAAVVAQHPAAQPGPVHPLEPRAATTADVDSIWQLISEAARTTTVLPRTRDNIFEHLRDFVVVEHEGRIVACGALCVMGPSLAEVKSLVVAEGLRGQGLGKRIVMALLDQGRKLGLRRVFALSDNPPIFERMGFRIADRETLPQKVWRECIVCPKYLNCTETAVEIILQDEGPARPAGHTNPTSLFMD